MAISVTEAEDFSASATIIAFDPPMPLLRGPLPAGLSDDLSIGPFVLAFKDAESWKSAFQACESKILDQCEAGGRIGCSISASSKCKPPWWRTLFGGGAIDLSEREQCEEREMSACLASSRESCLKFSKDKCLKPFREARIALIDPKEVSKLLYKCNMEVTNFRGSVILDSETKFEDSSSKISSCNEADQS